jgi:hypothetical protein
MVETGPEYFPQEIRKLMIEPVSHPCEFEPHATYNAEGDLMEVYLLPVPNYAQWINPQLTVLRSMENDTIVGMLIHGIKHLL